MSQHCSAVVLVIFSLIAQTHSSGWWMDQPYTDSADFNEDVLYEANVTLYCNATSPNYTFKEWIRPDLTVMKDGDDQYFRTLYAIAGWRVDIDEMEIIYAQERHFGFYYCRLEDANGNSIYMKKGVNYKGPYFGNLWEVYEMNVIIGCSAAGGFLLACIIIYVVHRFCIEDDDDVPAYGENNGPPEWNGASNDQYVITTGSQNNGYYDNEKPPIDNYVQLDTAL